MNMVGPSLLFGLVGGLVSACLVTPIVLAVMFYRLPQRKCPNCAVLLPRFSRPQNLEQALCGGRNCPNCGQALGPGRTGSGRLSDGVFCGLDCLAIFHKDYFDQRARASNPSQN